MMNRNPSLRQDAEEIARSAIHSVLPDQAVVRALEQLPRLEKLHLVAIGKAAWQMAAAAVKTLERPLRQGFVLTKYGHVMGEIPGVICFEAGHPVPDEAGFQATQTILDATAHLTPSDTVLLLLSGGGSALFEKPLVPPATLQAVTRKLLEEGADIVQINTVRKRLSGVKGGRFAAWCAPAQVEAVLLSDILGDPIDMIASGPAAADPTTCRQALEIGERYGLLDDPAVAACLGTETPKQTPNVHTQVIGSVRELCRSAGKRAAALGYTPVFLTDRLNADAAETGRLLGQLLARNRDSRQKLAFLAGGETVVHVRGTGLGGRNQELALAAAKELAGIPNAALISVGSDGTDGPTDAAGGYVDGFTLDILANQGLDAAALLRNNDAYHALQAAGGLILTGPTGTNVNDVTIGLIAP